VEITKQPRSMKVVERAASPVLGKSYIVYARKQLNGHVAVPDVGGGISAVRGHADRRVDRVAAARHRDDPVVPGGHCDPWNHVETAMALDVAGLHTRAERAYEWLVDIQRDDGSWWNYYLPTARSRSQARHQRVRLHRHGVWHHWLCTWDRAFVDHLWPTVQRALDWVLSMRRDDGTVLWACTPTTPVGLRAAHRSSSIAHACAAAPAGRADQRATTDGSRRRPCAR
jgi:hypothetical protein